VAFQVGTHWEAAAAGMVRPAMQARASAPEIKAAEDRVLLEVEMDRM
jgi:hypothetical protein